MKSLLKDNWFVIGMGILIIVVLILLQRAFLLYPSDFINIAWYALVGFTAIYAFVSMMVMTATFKQAKETRRMIEEIRQSRLDAVKPALSLQPGWFFEGGGFGALYLRNSGGVSKEVKVDIEITDPSEKISLFIPAINKEHEVLLPIKNIHEAQRAGSHVKVYANFKDSYNQNLSETLSIDFANLKEEGRDVMGQESEQHEISRVLERIEHELRDIERKIK
ncbi:MAG: hypothetical protein D4S01_07850 [Dehalococcoidia bacterium]|nr:MAG: hypothetical protein D4S01_07850 [Dehalococcoidia bacterium]